MARFETGFSAAPAKEEGMERSMSRSMNSRWRFRRRLEIMGWRAV